MIGKYLACVGAWKTIDIDKHAIEDLLSDEIFLKKKSKLCLDLLHSPPLQQVQHVRGEEQHQVQQDSLHTILYMTSMYNILLTTQLYLCPASYLLDSPGEDW